MLIVSSAHNVINVRQPICQYLRKRNSDFVCLTANVAMSLCKLGTIPYLLI